MKLIETTDVNINAVKIQGIWDEEDEALNEVVSKWGILPKGVIELKKRVLEDNVANITRSGKHYKPFFLENDHLGRDLGKCPSPRNLKETKKKRIGS